MSDLASRWAAWQASGTRTDGDIEESGNQTDLQFGVRGDGSMVCFDKEGCFFIVDTGPGMDPAEPTRLIRNLFVLEDHRGNRDRAYIEPMFVAGFLDHFAFMFGTPARWDYAE